MKPTTELDTIAAVASAPGGAARGIIRISGPRALECLASIGDSTETSLPTGLRGASASAGSLVLPEFCAPVPCDFFVWPCPRSYTREPTVELHLPGSPPILEAALTAACRNGARPAKPGEFTLRAFLAGRIDLTQAEAVLGAIDARDERELQTALKQMAGGLAGPLTKLRGDLLDLLAHLEAGLDFVEEDIEFISRDELLAVIGAARDALLDLQRRMTDRTDAAVRPTVVLVGAPNVGKSSLFNALAGGAHALASPQAGTTRDYLAAAIDCDGVAVELVDTAGLAPTALDAIDAAAQRGSREQAGAAALTLACFDRSRAPTSDEAAQLRGDEATRIVVWTKADLPPAASTPALVAAGHAVVALDDEASLRRLRTMIAERSASLAGGSADVVATTAVRCRASLAEAARQLDDAERTARERRGEELVAAALRAALDELGEIVGAIYTDDILDRIFSRFCIGK